MRTAYLAVRSTLPGRLSAISDACTRLGYEIRLADIARPPTPSDICISWNRFGRFGMIADAVEAAGGRVIVLENGYCGKDPHGRPLLAVAAGHHLGAGKWLPQADAHRWASLGLELAPWRKTGRHVLVCLSRGLGAPTTAMPKWWAENIARNVKLYTGREIRIRTHPNAQGSVGLVGPSLAEDLVDAHVVVTWGSNAGTEALLAGVPVIHGLDCWIMAPAASPELHAIEDPPMPDRLPAFIRLSWAQWTLDEIATGEPFARLLVRGNQ